MRIFACLLLTANCLFSQNYEQVRARYDTYLNYKGSLDKLVEISPSQITLYKYVAGKKETEFVLKKQEWSSFAALCKELSQDSLEKIFDRKCKDNSYAFPPTKDKTPRVVNSTSPLGGTKIMIDPGHIAGNMGMARIEQKYLHFTKENYPPLKADSIDIAEGILTFQTAALLKKMLEEKGAEVVLTRKENSTAFGISYDEWLKTHKKKTLDSLKMVNKLTTARHKQLMKMNKGKFFVEFFKDLELLQRSRVINKYGPDLTVIIHYNVNEKNNPWLKPSDKNFCMAFIPGCLIADNLASTTGKLNFLRLVLCDDVDKSEKFSSLLVKELAKQLQVPVAKSNDASYLEEHCMKTSSEGVFCRNLALCRLVQSPLMYGECLYQDNEKECYELVKHNEEKYGIKTNSRVLKSASAYLQAILDYGTGL